MTTTTIVIREIPKQRVATIRARVPMSGIGPEMREGFEEIATAATAAGVAIDGLAFAIHHEIDAGKVDIEFGFPVTADVESGRVHTFVLEGVRAACAMHEGPYDEVGATYEAAAAWIRDHGERTAGPPRELYLNEPAEGVVPLTEVQIPIA